MLESLKSQIGGDHYKSMKIQPAEFILANGLGHYEAAALEYISRWQHKGGPDSLAKAQQCLQILIDHNNEQESRQPDQGHQAAVNAARNAERKARHDAEQEQAKGRSSRA